MLQPPSRLPTERRSRKCAASPTTSSRRSIPSASAITRQASSRKHRRFALGAVQQAQKDYQKAIASYGYSSFLDLENPKPQLHAAECYLALGDKGNAASAIMALEHYCPANTDLGREYRAKAAELRKAIGEEEFKIEE